MKFDKLSERAKERARDWWRQDSHESGWWDYTYDYVKAMGRIIGIDIEDISFEGFSSQGDGCAFTGTLHIVNMQSRLSAMTEAAPKDIELHAFAVEADRLYNLIATYQVGRVLDGEDPRELGTDSHVTVYSNSRYWRTYTEPNIDASILVISPIDKFLDDFASWIYGRLEAASEDIDSEKNVDFQLKDSDYEFDEDGNPE